MASQVMIGPSEIVLWPKRIRTFVVDDSSLFLDTVEGLLDEQPFVDVVGTANDGAEALQGVCELRPDLVLMDVNMPGMDGLETASLVHTLFPATKIMMMSSDPELEPACRKSGANAFARKDNLKEEFGFRLNELFAD